MAGDRTIFTGGAAVEATSTVVDPIVNRHSRAIAYKPGGWGPEQADALLGPGGRWLNPRRTIVDGSGSSTLLRYSTTVEVPL
jgi:glucose-6-phosphate 1-dehydrogenase